MKLLKSILSLFLLAFSISIASGVNLAYTTPAVFVGAFLVQYSQLPMIAAWDNVDLTAISRYATKFQRQLITTMINGLDVLNSIMLYPGVKNYTKLPKLVVGNGFRPYSGTTEFGTKKDLVYSDREIKTEAGKRELLIDPEDYRATYLSEMLSPGSGANKKEIPFAQFTMQKVIENLQREINDMTVWYGFNKADAAAWDSGTAYAAADGDYVTFTVDGRTEYFQVITDTTAGQSPATHPAKWKNVTAAAVVKGFGTIIAEEITAGGIVPTATGAIDNTAGVALAAFRKLFRAQTDAIKNNGVIIHASFTDVEFLLDDIEDKLTKYTQPDVTKMMQQGFIPLPGTGMKGWVKPATWLNGSRRLIANPMNMSLMKDQNMFFGTDLLSDLNTITTKENLWTLETGVKAVIGMQIADLEAIKVGNQA